MSRYIAGRLGQAIITLWLISVIVFVLARLSGDPLQLLAPPDATKEQMQLIRQSHGLDKSELQQYVIFVKGALHGDFGDSIRFRLPALGLVVDHLPASLELAGTAMLITLVVGLSVGIASGIHQGGKVDRVGKLLAILGQSMPIFWLGIMLILIFSVKLGWLPVAGKGGIKHLILPAFTLASYPVASLIRITRSAVLDVVDLDYVRLAHIKGLNPARITFQHILRNAAIPIVTLASLQFVFMINGSVVTETIFSWPGVAKFMLDAVYARDFPIVQAGVLIISVMFVATNLAVDLLYGVLDPRIRY